MASWFDVVRQEASYPAVGCTADEKYRLGLLRALCDWKNVCASEAVDTIEDEDERNPRCN
jgi:hypothetical protein